MTFTVIILYYSLRSPKAPDGNCDMGNHEFSYAVMPHKGTLIIQLCIVGGMFPVQQLSLYRAIIIVSMLHHSVGYLTLPYVLIQCHTGTLQESGVIQQAYNFNHPLEVTLSPYYGNCFSTSVLYVLQLYAPPFEGSAKTFLSVDNPAIVIDTVKLVSYQTSIWSIKVHYFHASVKIVLGVPDWW